MNEDIPWSHPVLSQYIVHIGSVPRHCSRADLERFLQPFGEVAWLKLYKTKPPASRHAHAIFTRVLSYFELLGEPEHSLDGHKLRVSMWRKTPLGSRFSERLDRRKVFIKNLSDRLRIESVRKVLSKFGSVIHLDGLFDADNRQFRNIAFAVFATEAEALRCLENSQQIREQKGFKVRPYKSSLEASRSSEHLGDSALDQPSNNESAQGRENQLLQPAGLVPFAEYLNKRDAIDATRRQEGPAELQAPALPSARQPARPSGPGSASLDCSLRPAHPAAGAWPAQASQDESQTLGWASSCLGERAEELGPRQSPVPVSAGRVEASWELFAAKTAQSPKGGLINGPAIGWKSLLPTREVRVAFYTFPGGV